MPLFLLLFASANFVMPRSSPASFSYELTRTDSLYFTVTTFQHGGLRRYHGDQPDRQACGHRPNDLRPACPGLGHSRVPWGRAMGATGAARHHRSGNLTNDAADHCASWRPSPALRIGDSINGLHGWSPPKRGLRSVGLVPHRGKAGRLIEEPVGVHMYATRLRGIDGVRCPFRADRARSVTHSDERSQRVRVGGNAWRARYRAAAGWPAQRRECRFLQGSRRCVVLLRCRPGPGWKERGRART